MKNITTCLWFNKHTEAAVDFYCSLFSDSKKLRVARRGETASKMSSQAVGSVLTIEFELAGHRFLALDGGPQFKFSLGNSLFVNCESEREVDHLWQRLSQNGEVKFELQKYPWAEKYGWCVDAYGIPWQLILAPASQKIAPSLLFMGALYGRGEEALEFYTSLFDDAKVEMKHLDPQTKTLAHSSFIMAGQRFVLMEGDRPEKQIINQAMSFIIYCETQKQIDDWTLKLTKNGGSVLACGWVKDRFGVSWQITPGELPDMIANADSKRADQAFKAMLQMKKLDFNKLKQAFES